MTTTASTAKFSLGRVVITRNAWHTLPMYEVIDALDRHVLGDWGDIDEQDRQQNEFSLREGCRLLSVYHTDDGTKFWIITEWDRSVTTVLLPEDY